MVELFFNRSQLFLDMRCAVFPLLRSSLTHGIPHKNASERSPSRERFTFWGFRRPDRAVQPISEAREYAGRQRGKALRCLATSGSGGNPPEWFTEVVSEFESKSRTLQKG